LRTGSQVRFKQLDCPKFAKQLSQLNDDSLAPLREAQQLSFLFAEDNALTDGCLEYLAAIPNLSEVYLGGTQVTYEGVKRAQKLKPGLKIVTLKRKVAERDGTDGTTRADFTGTRFQ
jgi:hypothetical protein